jgi:hypothetical protein
LASAIEVRGFKMIFEKPQLAFEIVYHDEHMLQIEVRASNGRFSGITYIYSGFDGMELFEFQAKLKGFPNKEGQTVKHKFGFNKQELEKLKGQGFFAVETAYLEIIFICFGKKLQTAVDINIIENSWTKREAAIGRASFELLFYPAALDQFVQELSGLRKNKEGKATLIGVFNEKDTG